jgi:hypothetical protein
MILFIKIGKNDDNAVYKCAQCGAPIASSGSVFKINGSFEHSYTNPAGILCNFITFNDCENIISHPDLFLENSWFSGYGWRFVNCGVCMSHLGWQYYAVGVVKMPATFFGLLVDKVKKD